MKRPARQSLPPAALAAVIAFAAGPVFADPCDALYQAGIKSIQTPHHVYSTTTMRAGPPRSGEAIFAGGAEYLKIGGQWKRSPMPQQEMVEAAQERMKTHPDTCTPAGTQTVGGQAVAVYKVHNREHGTDQMVRILPASGLLQGSTLTLPNGSVVDTRYDYADVQAPAGVH